MKQSQLKRLVALALALALLSACAVPTSQPAQTATLPPIEPTAAAQSTATLPPGTPTPAVTVTPAFTSTLAPTVTAAPASTATLAAPAVPASQTKVSISYIHMLDIANGWGIGKTAASPADQILRTADGGVTWQNVTPEAALKSASNPDQAATGFFLDLKDAWVTFHDRGPAPSQQIPAVFFTQDGGKTWKTGAPLNFTNLPQDYYIPSDIAFVDANTGWLFIHLGAGMMHDYFALFGTTDGGQNWKRLVDPARENGLPMSCYKSGMVFTDAKNGWVAGSCEGVAAGVYFYRTADGGASWSLVNLPAPAEKPAAFTDQQAACGSDIPQFLTPSTGMVPVMCSFLNDNTHQAWLYTTQDGGKTWKANPLPQPYGRQDFASPGAGWWLGRAQQDASGGNQLYFTQNAGQSWKELTKTIWDGQLDFLNETTGWVAATAGDAVALVKTINGGATWQELQPVITP